MRMIMHCEVREFLMASGMECFMLLASTCSDSYKLIISWWQVPEEVQGSSTTPRVTWSGQLFTRFLPLGHTRSSCKACQTLQDSCWDQEDSQCHQ